MESLLKHMKQNVQLVGKRVGVLSLVHGMGEEAVSVTKRQSLSHLFVADLTMK